MLTGCQRLDSLLTMSYMHGFIRKIKLNMSFSGLIHQNMYAMHKKLKYVYIVQTFVFVKKSYFGDHLGCQF